MSTPTFFTAENHLDDHGIALVVDALTLDRMEALPGSVLQHMESCDRCKQQILETAAAGIPLPQTPSTRHPYFDARPTVHMLPKVWYNVAALFLLAVIGSGTFYLVISRSALPPERSIVQPADRPSPPDLAAAEQTEIPPSSAVDRYTPSPNLDDLIHSEFRSATLEIIAPKNGDPVSTPVTFRWTDHPQPLKLKVLTNKEVTILTAIVQHGRYTTAKRFEPGLYYWKLESDDELAAIGTFTIR
jgi:hypothetical protein